MTRRLLAFVACVAFASAASAETMRGFLRYEGKETNQLLWDNNFQERARQFFGDAKDHYLRLNRELTILTVMETLGGPPDIIRLEDHRYLVATSCRPPLCKDKAMIVMDTFENKMAFGLFHYYKDASDKKTFNPDGYITLFFRKGAPNEFKQAVTEQAVLWQHRMGGSGPERKPEIVLLK